MCLAVTSTLTQGVVPTRLNLGQPMLVDNAHLCVANAEEVDYPSLHALQSTAAKLHTWEDRQLRAIWNPTASCYDAALGSQLAVTDPNAIGVVPAECVTLACGSELVCAVGGLSNECTVLDSLNNALNVTNIIASDTAALALAVREAAVAANGSAVAREALSDGPQLDKLRIRATAATFVRSTIASVLQCFVPRRCSSRRM